MDCVRRSFGVSIRLDGDVGWFVLVALSVSSSCLDHGGCQMLGSNNQMLLDLEHGRRKT
jgi:hypothetical protein